jgi:glyoxylase-like metal-dependent hydrolase (beta-lactamase superfamily II)
MGEFEMITDGVYQVGGSELSHPNDAAVFIIACGPELVMIDCGAGGNPQMIEENIREAGLDPNAISTLLLTHCHVDHIGSVHYFREKYKCSVTAHDLDAAAIETGDGRLTAARWYNTSLQKTVVDHRLTDDEEIVSCGEDKIFCIHTPGHTPGSISPFMERNGLRILFGQDIHGPFSKEFNSDIRTWRHSMEKLLELKADILCEGHFGIYKPRERVEHYIRGYLEQYSREYP